MKKAVIILLIVIPVLSNAQTGWSFKSFSLFYGGVLSVENIVSNNIEILFDRGVKNCMIKRYYGVGIVSIFNSEFAEIGIKGQINPSRITIEISRHTRLLPYVFFQGNLKKSKNSNESWDLSYRPGLGIIGNISNNGVLNFRPSFQIGYTLNDKYIDSKSKLILELKVGIGLNLENRG